MIPLRYSEGLSKFPQKTFQIAVFWGLLYFSLKLIEHFSQIQVFEALAFSPAQAKIHSYWTAAFIAPNFSYLLLHLWFFWIFAPLFELKKHKYFFVFSLLGGVPLGFFLYQQIYPQLEASLLSPQLSFCILFGWILRKEIWSNIDTLVFGPKLFQVFQVPTYVIFFFYLFYLFLSQLSLSLPWSSAPSPYFLALWGLLWGFACSFLAYKKSKDPILDK